MQALLLFPHQLFESNKRLAQRVDRVFLIEDPLFFSQYRFHQQKLVLHRASMQAHAHFLREQGVRVAYVDFASAATPYVFEQLGKQGIVGAHVIDVVDDWLQQRLNGASSEFHIPLTQHPSPMFLSSDDLLEKHFCKGAAPRMAQFYMDQRRRTGILMQDNKPMGGRWSFDQENRKKLPKGYPVPLRDHVPTNPFVPEAQRYVSANFAGNPGSVEPFDYPVTPAEARAWLGNFIHDRLAEFGAYEDAISQNHDVLFHSVLTPALNIGLLTPGEAVAAALAHQDVIPINSLEGFIRQIVGWREYMRGAYRSRGRMMRTQNAWHHVRPIPASFWSGNTSIAPLDMVINKLLRCAYAHHIERLMVMSNFMLLCEFHPDQVYQWFMEMFIDSYDWVMVPNVYAMALYADGGSITTKPYISSSNYVLKMSDFKRGPWCDVWDALYWRFIDKHREEFSANHRTEVLVMGLVRMGAAKRSQHLQTAETFLRKLGG